MYLKIGESFKVYPYQWHQLGGSINPNNEVEIIECSTYHEDSDTYRDATDWYDIGVSKKKE